MTHSIKHFPAGTCCVCKSQHAGKKLASRRFRRKTRTLIHQGKFHRLPIKSIELTSPWDLGGDGKIFYGFFDVSTDRYTHTLPKYFPNSKEWWLKCMRK